MSINLYQCNTDTAILNTTISLGMILDNRLDSCNISCCTSNSTSNTGSSNLCQVTVWSSTNICLGRLCYSDDCERFPLLANTTNDYKIKNKTTIIDQIRSSFSHIPWSSIVNSTQTKFSSLVNRTGLTTHHTIIAMLLTVNISLTSMTLIVVIKSIRHASLVAEDKSYRYSLL